MDPPDPRFGVNHVEMAADVGAVFDWATASGRSCADRVDDAKVGKLAVFAGVREFPMRVKCATLAWHTMRSALDNDQTPVTTE